MKTTTVSKRFVTLICCIAVCVALIATALGLNLTSRAQAEDAQEDGIELLEAEPTGDIQIIEEEIPTPSEGIVGEEASQAGETAVAEETQTPAEEPVSGEPDDTPVPGDSKEPEGSTEPDSAAVPDDAAEPENPAEAEGTPEESGEPEDAEPAGSEEPAEPDLPGTDETGETVDAAEPEPEDIDAIAENADAEDADAEEEATSEDDYGIMLLAENGTCGENLEWVLDDEGVLTISGTGAMDDWSTIPAAPWYHYRYSIKSVVIEDGVTSIGDWAFYDCTSLTGITIPESVTSIGECAFYWCTALSGILIPEGVKSIGESAFAYCTNLESVELPSTLTSIGDNAFRDCDALSSIEIPEGVTRIGNYVFQYCMSLESIELPSGLTSIGDYAFFRCYDLSGISIPDNVTYIGNYAFSDCVSLTDISIPEGITSIGDYAFQYCPLNGDSMTATTTVNAGAEVYSINSEDTTYTAKTTTYTGHTLTLPDSVISVGQYAFAGTSVDYFVIGSSLTSITGSAFASNSLEAIIFDNSSDQVTVDSYAAIVANTDGDVSLVYRNDENGFELSLTKEVIGYSGPDTFEFEITLTQQDGTPFSGKLEADGTADVVSFTDGKTTVSVGAGETLTLLWVPENMEWSIVEVTPAGETEIFINGSEAEAEGILTEDTAVTFVNYYKTGITVSIVWDDADDADGLRPPSIEVQLWADDASYGEPVELNADNRWSTAWSDLDIFTDGHEIEYVVEVDVPDDYEADGEWTDNDDGTYTLVVTNTHTPETTDISVSKVWDDADDQDGIRPDSIEVVLLVDGDPTDDTLTLNEDNGWSGSFTSLTKYHNHGEEIAYSIDEVQVDGYTTEISGDAESGFVITNTHTPEQFDATVIKVWDDADNQDGIRPDSITIHLMADNAYEVASATITPDAEGTWSYTFEGLPKYADGHEIVYRVIEDDVWGYVNNPLTLLSSDSAFGYELMSADSATDKSVTITNTHIPETMDVTVSKVWDDADDADGIRPDSITIYLLIDDEIIDTQTLSEENGWSYTWENLAVYADGNEIEYTVGEDEVDGYEPSADVTDNGDGTYLITFINTHTPEGETSAPAMSDDVGAGTEVNPGESITYTIRYTNGDQDGATITITDVLDEGLDFVSATDGGVYDEATRTITWVISDVPANYEGSVSFTVVVNENALTAGQISNSATVQINDEPAVTTNTVTNPVKTASTVTFEVVKVWDDNNDLYGERPELIVVVLLQNGQATTLTQLLSAENSWTGTFSDLPEYDENGEKIIYSIAEVTVPNYISVITGDQDSGFTVTNTYDFDEITNPDSGNPNTGTPNSGNPEPGVPQTGQDSLPIAPIAVSGAVIVAAGVALLAVRRRRAA